MSFMRRYEVECETLQGELIGKCTVEASSIEDAVNSEALWVFVESRGRRAFRARTVVDVTEIAQSARTHVSMYHPAVTSNARTLPVGLIGCFAVLLCVGSTAFIVFRSAAPARTAARTATLRSGDDVFLARTEAAYDRITEISVARDESALAEILLSGEISIIKDGTTCEVISPGLLKSKVRISSGDQRGTVGYVASDFVR